MFQKQIKTVHYINAQVWPAIGITLIVSGPIMYAIIALPNLWQPRFRVRSHGRLFFDCFWFTSTIILRQSMSLFCIIIIIPTLVCLILAAKEPSQSNKARLFTILLSVSATYVISDMYSANLTSLLAKPGRGKTTKILSKFEYVN